MKIVKDSAWNFLSIIIPSLIAIPAFSYIARLVGIELFGIFTLSFAIVGYASIFDLGLSRAIIREVAINRDNNYIVTGCINTATSLILILSSLACLILFFSSPVILDLVKVSLGHTNDVLVGLKILAPCLSLLLISNIWLAYFEGLEQFKSLSYFKVFSSIATVIFPLLGALYQPTFTMLMIGLLISRSATLVASWLWIKKYVKLRIEIQRRCAKALFNFGGWLTISSIVGPVMVYFDRFILSYTIGASQVAFYSAPSELVMRLLALPNAVARTLFPQFSANKDNQVLIYRYSIIALGLSSCLIALPLFIFSEQILVLWLGRDFIGEPKWVFRILLVGFVFNAMAQIPFTRLQAKGFSKHTALVHCYEILPYLVVLHYLTINYGIIGVAVTWLLRVFIDTLIFLYLDMSKDKFYE